MIEHSIGRLQFFLAVRLAASPYTFSSDLWPRQSMAVVLTEDDLQKLYAWIDQIPLTRPKKNISRDFSDACLIAEVSGIVLQQRNFDVDD